MPKYRRFIANSRNNALKLAEKEFGTRDITILREFPIEKKKFFSKNKNEYLIEVAQYQMIAPKNLILNKEVHLTKEKSKKKSDTSAQINKSPFITKQKIDQEKIKAMIDEIKKIRNIKEKNNRTTSVSIDSNITSKNWVGGISSKEEKEEKQDDNYQIYEENHLDQYLIRRSEKKIKESIFKDISPNARAAKEQGNLYDFLAERDFSNRFIKIITEKFIEEVGDTFDCSSRQCRKLARCIASFFVYKGKMKVDEKVKNLFYLVGPTGVGKTTTLAKLSAQYLMDEDMTDGGNKNHKESHQIDKMSRIKIASFDIKRMMAMEQIAAFAKIIGASFRKIFQQEHLKELLEKESKIGHLIMIDTSGVSVKEKEDIQEISSFIKLNETLNEISKQSQNSQEVRQKKNRSQQNSSVRKEKNIFKKEVLLCLNAGSRYNDLKKVMETLKSSNYTQVVITKVDESYSLGSVLSALAEKDPHLPISYLTDGQDVPNAIKVASAEVIENLLFEEWS